MKIRANDTVVVISGEYKGTVGKVSQVFPKTHKVIVEGVNERKKHVKPDQNNTEGRIVTIYAPIDISNVALVDEKTNKAGRVGFTVKNGKKVRVVKPSKIKVVKKETAGAKTTAKKEPSTTTKTTTSTKKKTAKVADEK